MCPRSPESPILQMQQRRKNGLAIKTSGSLAARRAAQYTYMHVNDLQAGPFQITQACLPSALKSAATLSGWSPTFPAVQANCINLRHAPVFDPLHRPVSSFSQLLSLDMLPALGCMACHNFMTARTVPYHICPDHEIEPTFNAETVRKGFFLSSLDVHNPGHEAGLPEEDFKAIFYVCEQWSRPITTEKKTLMQQEVGAREGMERGRHTPYAPHSIGLTEALKAEIDVTAERFEHLDQMDGDSSRMLVEDKLSHATGQADLRTKEVLVVVAGDGEKIGKRGNDQMSYER
ncbi:hypothetical protein BJ912DRAFT_925727 [Pholiota molesta]|nr:hypothetical protein BJ912DRAFT_925727 [Pholiota molesta]